jgi:hypothetical protein
MTSVSATYRTALTPIVASIVLAHEPTVSLLAGISTCNSRNAHFAQIDWRVCRWCPGPLERLDKDLDKRGDHGDREDELRVRFAPCCP